ncbi:MAG: hypothetical protein Q7T89_00890, partial [Anaerolineales bacterium]|nr:hypothetical protein [Anaerolineales bacterium]
MNLWDNLVSYATLNITINRTPKTAVEGENELIAMWKASDVWQKMSRGFQNSARFVVNAIGAIGIGRAFAYGGYKNRPMYDPETQNQMHASFEQYKNSKSATINHFYEKLLLLKDMMNTATAKRIAEQRHEVMLKFLEQFMNEWEGKDLG